MAVNRKPDPPVALLVNVRDAARMLAISERTCWNLVRDHELKSVRLGHRVLIRRADLEEYVDNLRSRCFTDGEAAS